MTDGLTVFFGAFVNCPCKRCAYNVGVNFINILQAAFMHVHPKSAKTTDGLTVFLALL